MKTRELGRSRRLEQVVVVVELSGSVVREPCSREARRGDAGIVAAALRVAAVAGGGSVQKYCAVIRRLSGYGGARFRELVADAEFAKQLLLDADELEVVPVTGIRQAHRHPALDATRARVHHDHLLP